MKKSPGFWFFTGDWLKDPELRFCSIFARGLLIDLLCYMFEAKEQGYMTWSDGTPRTDLEIVDAIVGGTTEEKLSALKELERKGVLSRDSRNALYSRRMSKLKELSEIRKNSGSKGGSKSAAKKKQKQQQTSKQKGGVTVTDTDSDSVSDSVSDSKNKKDSSELSQATEPVDSSIVFDCVGSDKGPWSPPLRLIQVLKDAFPNYDVIGEMRKAVAWTVANPAKRKTKKGMPAFLNRWMELAKPTITDSTKPQKTQEEKDAILAQIRAQRAKEDAKRGT